MRWFKHLSMAHADEELDAVMDEFGAEAYGVYWLMIEDISAPMEPGKMEPAATHSAVKWASICRCSVRRWKTIADRMEKKGLIVVRSIDNRFQIEVPNILKYKDEYSKKSGQTPEQEQIQIQSRDRTEKPKASVKPPVVELVPEKQPDNWFEEKFWPLWPVKENKIPAKRAAAKLNESDREAALAGVIDWAFRIKSMERPIHAATWLNGRRWEDEKHKPGAREPTLFSNFNPSKESFAAGVLRRAQERIERGERPL